MLIKSLRLVGIRCFEDTGDIEFNSGCNIFVGVNNVGKSTVLRGILAYQGFPFSEGDIRPQVSFSYHDIVLTGPGVSTTYPDGRRGNELRVFRSLVGDPVSTKTNIPKAKLNEGSHWFPNQRPKHTLVPFLARRKATHFDQSVNTQALVGVSGTYTNLYSRIDLVAAAGHPRHSAFQEAIREIVGLPVTTRAAQNGKEAGFYLDDDTFVSLDRMGDGVTEMVAMIVEMSLESNKIFVLEEPETNLHPSGLKALLGMVRASAEKNQFFIATHSNIVVRDLGSDETSKVFRVGQHKRNYLEPSIIEEVPRTPEAHRDLLRELGYEFADLGLHDAWLFLEESSAESIFLEVLIPIFAPGLSGKLRTYSAGGASNLEPSVSEFQRLITFVHLQPAYRGRIWIRADGDSAGQVAIEKLRKKFNYLTVAECSQFNSENFEEYYPSIFQARAKEIATLQSKAERRKEKADLLKDVIGWTKANSGAAQAAWELSASEPIELLRHIEAELS